MMREKGTTRVPAPINVLIFFVFSLALIGGGAHSFNFSKRILTFPVLTFPETHGLNVKVYEKENVIIYSFEVNGKQYQGMKRWSAPRITGLDVRYNPEDPSENYPFTPNTWHAILAVAVGCFNFFVFFCGTTNLDKLRIGKNQANFDEDALRRLNIGIPKLLKYILAGLSMGGASLSVFASNLVDIFASINLIFLLIGPVGGIYCSGSVITAMPLFCRLAGVKLKPEKKEKTG